MRNYTKNKHLIIEIFYIYVNLEIITCIYELIKQNIYLIFIITNIIFIIYE